MKTTILLVSILLSGAILSAQETGTTELDNQKGKNALQFTCNGLQLGSFDGGFGWKKSLANDRAIKGIVKIAYLKDDKKATEQLSGLDQREFGVALGFGMEKYFKKYANFLPYWGGNAMVGYSNRLNKVIPTKPEQKYYFNPEYKNEIKTVITSVTLGLVLGAEYFIRNNISIAGEYSLSGRYEFGQEKQVSNIVDDQQDVSGLRLGISASALILSIYW